MRRFLAVAKRAIIGEPIPTDRMAERKMRTWLALPVFGAGILSAVAYAPDALVSSLRAGGQAGSIPFMALGTVSIMLLLGFAYRANVVEFGGLRGDYGVVTHRLGARAGVVSGAALLIDYLLTVAVSVAAIGAVADFVWPQLEGYESAIGVVLILVMTLGALRGVKERARVLALVWFGFILVVVTVAVVGIARHSDDTLVSVQAAPSGWAIVVAYGGAVASGAVMVTGIEHLAASGRFHREPRGLNAGRTLVIAVAVSAALFFVVAYLAWAYGSGAWEDGPILLQVADGIFGGTFIVWIVAGGAAAILYTAAAAVFRRFTQLASVLARDGFLPRQLHSLNDRAVFGAGVMMIAIGSSLVVAVSGADLLRLVHVYIVGVFTSIVLTQVAMVGHWTGRIKVAVGGREQWRGQAFRLLHGAAAVAAAAVWLVVVVFNVASGAWAAVLLIAILVVVMWGIRRHYDTVRRDVVPVEGDRSAALPSATHGIVLVAQLHRPALRAIAYARAMRHDTLTAVGVSVDKRATKQLQREWGERNLGLRLTIIDSPYREFVNPIIGYIKAVRRTSPREMIVVYVPEYVVRNWWERFLHNRSGARLRAKLQQIPGVVVTAVPWHLHSASGDASGSRR